MRFKWIRVHKLTFAVLLAATCMIGWVRTVTVAQNPSQSQAPRTSIHISTGSSEDPEKAAMALAERDANLAEAQLKSLRDEAAKLRHRLRRVEGGIKRWESLLGALRQSQGVAPRMKPDDPPAPSLAVPVPPTSLEDVPARAGEPRNQK